MRKLEAVMRKFFDFLRKQDTSFCCIFAKGEDGAIAIGGERGGVCATMHNAISKYQKGKATEGEEAFVETLLDVIALTYSPAQISQEMAKRVDQMM